MIVTSNCADALTGERIFPGEVAIDTGYKNKTSPYQNYSKTKMIKEETLVRLAEEAGYALVKRDAGDSGDAEGVDGEDASVGGGEAPVGEAKAGGKSASK
jgi:F420-0:gamma-glutamyl ligase